MNTELHHLAAAYALDALDPDERQAFEAHYPTCEICTADVTDYREVAAGLATAEEAVPSADLRARVLAEISQTRQISPRDPRVVDLAAHRRTRYRILIGAVAASLLLVVGVITFGDESDRGTDSALIDLLASPDLGIQPLHGESPASVTVAWSAEAGAVAVLASDLADPGDGLAYALWLIDDGGASPSLLFTPSGDGLVEALGVLDGDPVAWGITIEPEAGSPQPTGDIIFSGEI